MFRSLLNRTVFSHVLEPLLVLQRFGPPSRRQFWESGRWLSTMSQLKLKSTVDHDAIIKSAEDKRQYRGLELTNGLKVLLVSDPATDESSAALDVHVGHMCDPDGIPGLAHFCEHMLFLGTEKYPKEDEYNKYLSEHAGSSNAFTSAEHTNFYFDVAPDHLKGALDRFAQFFLCPLFTASATEREVNAVNSENDKNLQNDSWRLFQLEKSTSNPSHPYSKFGTGNKTTLETIPKEQGIDPRDELLKFHQKYYSANIMGLVILGKEPLDVLSEMVVPLFGDVVDKQVEKPHWPEHPYGPEEIKLQAHVLPVKDIRSLSITWPIPDLQPYYKSNPGHYLGHLIGHEGPGSLLSELKNRGWVNQLVGGQKAGANGFMFFMVNVDLSEEGIEHTDDIVTLTFQYLNMLRQAGPQEWCFKECQDLNAMQFRFKDKEKPRNYTCSLAGLLREYPLSEVLCGGFILEEYRPDLYNMILEKLTPDTIRIAVIGKKFEGTTDKVEKWYETEYSIQRLSNEKLENWKNCGLHENLKLPMKNEFIPTNFDILPRDKNPHRLPVLIQDSDMSRVWYKQDDKFLLPKACVSVSFKSAYAFVDPLSESLTYMFSVLFRDALNEYSYDAELAGLSYSLHNTTYGLTFSMGGYNDKQHILLKRIMEKMTAFSGSIDPQRFDLLKDNYVRGLKNFKAEQPHQHAIYHMTSLTCEQVWLKEELLECTDEVTIERMKLFIPQLLSRLYLEFLVYGNVTQEKAHQMVDIVEEALKTNTNTRPLLPSQRKKFRDVQLPDGSSYVYKKENDVHKSSALEIYYQYELQRTESNMILELFCQIINQPCFDILRTKEQLGYIVFSGVRRSNGAQGLRVIIQSDRSPEYVETRVEAFLKHMQKHVDEMTAEVFENHVAALATRRLEQAKKMSGQNGRFWSEIASQQYNFDRDEIEVKYLKTLTKDDVAKFLKEVISHDGPQRRKLCVQITSTAEGNGNGTDGAANGTGNKTGNGIQPENSPVKTDSFELLEAPTLPEPKEITDINEYKRGLPLLPVVPPYIPLTMPEPAEPQSKL